MILALILEMAANNGRSLNTTNLLPGVAVAQVPNPKHRCQPFVIIEDGTHPFNPNKYKVYKMEAGSSVEIKQVNKFMVFEILKLFLDGI